MERTPPLAATGHPALVWRLDPPALAVATTVIGGGIGVRSWVLNAQVETGYHHPDPAAHLAEIAAELGLTGEGVGFLTAADVSRATSARDGGVTVDATVGLSHPTWAAAGDLDADPIAAPVRGAVPTAGTVNLMARVPARLSPAALVNAVATATEAKSQALLDLGVPGTGTASDAVCVACPADGSEEPYGGPRSTWGARLARAVHAAVLSGRARGAGGGGGRSDP